MKIRKRDDVLLGRSVDFLETVKQSSSPGKVLFQTVEDEAKRRGLTLDEAAHRCGVMRVYLEKLSIGGVEFASVQPATWLPFSSFLSIDPATFLIAAGRVGKSELISREASPRVLESASDGEHRWYQTEPGLRLISLVDCWSGDIQACSSGHEAEFVAPGASRAIDASLWKQLSDGVGNVSGGTLLRWLALQGLKVGASFDDLARIVGMSVRELSELFHGRRDPRGLSRSTLQKAASLLGVSPAGAMCAAGQFGNLHEQQVAQ